MGFIFETKKKEKTVAIFDIGSGSVGGAIVHIPLENNKVPTIIKLVRTDIKIRESFKFNLFMEDMISALSQTANSLYNKKSGAPDEIFCVLASPWYISETRVIKMSREKSFVFSKRLASELIQKEISELTELYKNEYGELDSIPQIIEQQVMSASLNGYNLSNPVGKKCNFVEMNMIISLAPKLCLDKIRDTLSKTFHHIDISFSSFILSTFLAVRDRYSISDSYLLLDVSGEITDVGIVTKGILKSVLSFPFGKKTFFNYMCTKLNIELRDAKELFNLYSENKLTSEYRNKVEPLFKSIGNSWVEAFNQCIVTLPHTLLLPDTIFLTADNDIRNWFANVLRDDKNIRPTSSSNKCIVVTLDGPEFLRMCDIKEGTCDPFIMIEAIAVMRKMTHKSEQGK